MPLFVLCVVLFLGARELLPSLVGLVIPLPIWIGAGVLLAIASNRDKQAGLPWRSPQSPPSVECAQKPREKTSPAAAVPLETTSASVAQPTCRQPELPRFGSQPSQRSISFTIRNPDR